MANLKGLISRWIQRIIVDSVNVILPTDIQARYSETVQTHSGVTVGPDAFSNGTWIDCEGFDSAGLTLMNDASASSKLGVHWSNDGVAIHADEALIQEGTGQERSGHTVIKARYARFYINNADTVAPHTMSAWVYLKA